MAALRPPGTEHGDRTEFLRRSRQRLAGEIVENHVHPPIATPDEVPRLEYRNLDELDLLGTFVAAAEQAAATCHVVPGAEAPAEVLEAVVAAAPGRAAVVSAEPEAIAFGLGLARLGLEVLPYDRTVGPTASIGVTSAVAAVAATGSVVLDVRRTASRGSSLVPPVHVCVFPVDRLVATPGDVLRRLSARPDVLPSNLVIVTGPSRTGDIEQLITLGVHGPIDVHLVVLGASR